MDFLQSYETAVKERAANGIPPLPLSTQECADLIEILKSNPTKELVTLLRERVSPGVDEAAYVKAAYLHALVEGKSKCDLISPLEAVKMLGTMLGGYNVDPLVEALSNKDEAVAKAAADALKNTILVYDAFNNVEELAKTNIHAKSVLESWANGEWFTNKPSLPEKMTLAVFKVPGETNTDDLSPASEAFLREVIFHYTPKQCFKNANPAVLKK